MVPALTSMKLSLITVILSLVEIAELRIFAYWMMRKCGVHQNNVVNGCHIPTHKASSTFSGSSVVRDVILFLSITNHYRYPRESVRMRSIGEPRIDG